MEVKTIVGLSSEMDCINAPILVHMGRRLFSSGLGGLGLIVALMISFQLKAAEFVDTVAEVKRSVVGVGSVLPTRNPPFRFYGTGFAVAQGDLILTNAHVVQAKLDASKLEQWVVVASTPKQRQVLPVAIVATDAEHDLALLKMDFRLPALVLTDGKSVREGQEYALTGFPIGAILGLYPVTHRAMISAISPIAIPAESLKQLNISRINRLKQPYQVLQLDAVAYPGNSGSPLYERDTGHVVGILNKAFVQQSKENVLSQPSAISYAIPAIYGRELLKHYQAP